MPELRSSPLRLVVTKSSVLPNKLRVAVFDGYAEVSVGRDIAPSASTPRLRLKEMTVSKYHAFIFYDGEIWSVVDVGSMHGTLLNGERLSASRTASTPHALHHDDELTLGSTTLRVHMHDDALPCEACALTEGNEIPLFDTRDRTRLPLPTPASSPAVPLHPRAAIATLRKDLLSRHASGAPSTSSTTYKDRAAFRRTHAPEPPPPARAQVHTPATDVSTSASAGPRFSLHPSPFQRRTSSPPAPLAQSNIGHQLLLKQGWTPGTGLGLSADARLEPVSVTVLPERVGLGADRSRTDSPAAAARDIYDSQASGSYT